MIKRDSFKMLTKTNGMGIPILKNQLHICRAINLLYEYEMTGLTPVEIMKIQETNNNLLQRIKRFEDWE